MAEQTPEHDHVPWITVDRQHSVSFVFAPLTAVCNYSEGSDNQFLKSAGVCNVEHTYAGNFRLRSGV